MMLNLKKSLSFILIGSAIITSCKKKNPTPVTPVVPTPTGYTVPTTYNFTNVSYGGQTTRLTMLDSISNYMKKGNSGIVLEAIKLKNMYSNTGSPFGVAALDASGKQLKSKTFTLDQAYFDDLFDQLAVASQSAGAPASDGVAGVAGGRLFDKNGVELSQVIKKQLMGAVFYYQANETYLSNLSVDDNITVVAGEGTAQEHHADEAFGYFGAPIDFPTNTTNARYWSDYCAELNPAINANTAIMNAFLKLRAAISNKDDVTRDAQVVIIKQQWERIVAGAAILELVQAKAAFGSDNVQMRHVLSEAIGFINSMKYNSSKQISSLQITAALTALGTNFHTVTLTQINSAITTLNAVYNFDLNAF